MPAITLHRARPFGYIVTRYGAAVDDPAGSMLVQVDWDYPGIAGAFGWSVSTVEESTAHGYSLPCEHRGTDGTIACPDCGTPAGAFIESAADWLDSHDGATADDPGYFTAD